MGLNNLLPCRYSKKDEIFCDGRALSVTSYLDSRTILKH